MGLPKQGIISYLNEVGYKCWILIYRELVSLTRLSKRFWALRHRFEEPGHRMSSQTNQELY